MFRLRKKVKEEKSLKSKNFLIISYKANISSLYFICIIFTAFATANIIVFVINYLTVRSILMIRRLQLAIKVLKQKTICLKKTVETFQELL